MGKDSIPAPLRRAKATYQARPSADQPGTLHQQLAALSHYFSGDLDTERERDPDGTWQEARRRAIPHAAGGTWR